jgi:hypothetical protein
LLASYVIARYRALLEDHPKSSIVVNMGIYVKRKSIQTSAWALCIERFGSSGITVLYRSVRYHFCIVWYYVLSLSVVSTRVPRTILCIVLSCRLVQSRLKVYYSLFYYSLFLFWNSSY